MKKEKYSALELEIIRFSSEDVIVTSTCDLYNPEQDETGGGPKTP